MRRLLLPGAVALVLGGVVDVIAHTPASGHWRATAADVAHLIVLAGMALCLAGLWSRQRKGDRNAVR